MGKSKLSEKLTHGQRRQELEQHALGILQLLGRDGELGTKDTPARWAKFMFEFLIDPKEPEMTLFHEEGANEMVVVSGIPFWSLCEHHLLPFYGTAAVGYIPNKIIVGISKLPRLVSYYASSLTNQERITAAVADHLRNVPGLNPVGVAVSMTAVHSCMCMRGIKAAGAETHTCKLLGHLSDPAPRAEFFARIARG